MSEVNRGIEAHLNPNVQCLKPSATLAINELSNELIANGRRVYKLGLGQSPFPVPQPVVEALSRNAHQKDYLAVQGLYELRESVANYHSRRGDAQCTADDVMIGPGSKELMYILQLTYSGRLLIPRPSWVSYEPQAGICGLETTWLDTRPENGWRLSPDELDAACRKIAGPKLLILNYPSNPTGLTLNADHLKGIAEVAERHGVLIMSDEIYGELNHRGEHLSIASVYPQGSIISSGLSKWCGAGGWRLGTFVFPKELTWLRNAMAAVASETFTSVSAPIQHAAVAAFDGGEQVQAYLNQSRRVVAALGLWVATELRNYGARIADPEGGFYLFPDFTDLTDSLAARGIHDSPTLSDRALKETGVAFLPGSNFGRSASELVVRLAYVNFDGARALELAAQQADDQPLSFSYLEEACPETLQAIRLLGEWLGN